LKNYSGPNWRRPLAVRLPLTLFRLAARLLPEGFRDAYMAEAVRDLERMLLERASRRGRLAALAAGLSATADLLRRVPSERWAAGRRGWNRRAGGRGWNGTDGGGGMNGTARGRGSEIGERMMSVWNDVRLAVRSLIRRPGYTAVAVLTLSLGVGATVAIFTVVNAVLLRPLPYPDADAIVGIRHHAPGLDLPELENSPGTVRFYQDEADFFAAVAAYRTEERNLIGGPQPDRVEVTRVSPEILELLGVAPALGRPFNPSDAEEGSPSVAILTHATWASRFGQDREILGRSVEFDGASTEIIGVMPPGFVFPDPEPVALLPLLVDPDGAFGAFGMGGIARLSAGLTLEQAAGRVRELQVRIPEYFGGDLSADFLEQAGWSVSVLRLQDILVGEEVASALWVVLATVGLVLLIACANVANLFLVRAESRQKELAVRTALGATRSRIATAFLTEALLVGAAGGAVGVLMAWSGVRLLVTRAPVELPRLHEVGVDASALAFAAAISLAAGLLLGAIPLLRYSGGSAASGLHQGSRGSTDGRERHRARNTLASAQLALALVLLVGSGLMLRSFQALRSVELGFDPAGVLTVGLSLGERVDDAEGAAFYQQVADEVAALPGVESVGLTTLVPVGGGSANGGSFFVESRPRDEGELPPVAMYKAIGADYLTTIRQPVVEGRDLTRADWQGGPPVAIVNGTFARRFLDGRALGEGIKWDSEAQFATIVGVVADAKESGLVDESRAWAYLPMVVGDWGYPNMDRMSLVIRSATGQTVPVRAVRDIVTRVDASVPITNVRTMEEALALDMAQTSFTMLILGIAATVALVLGAVGLFGVVSYVVSRRTREIGVRVAVGARAEDIHAMVLGQGISVSATGVAVGLAAAFGLTRLMGAVLYQVRATDPVTFVLGPVVLVTVALLATWLPARRASRVDPVVALRNE